MRGLSGYVQQRVDGWRTGSRGSQAFLLVVLLALVAVAMGVGALSEVVVPVSLWFLFLMLGTALLRFVPLLVLGVVLVAVVAWRNRQRRTVAVGRRVAA